MDDLIAGLIAIVLVAVFFSFYLFSLMALPLAVIFIAVFGLLVIQFIENMRAGKGKNEK
ncbi:MAG: hypothetical protein ACE5IQ_11385 [Candidatus Methylomirabilales bacterium]